MPGFIRSMAVAALLASAADPVAAQPPVNRDARIAAEFTARINAYMDLHVGLERKLPELPNDATPEQINKHQRAFAQLIAEARKGAGAGDVFTPDTRALFRRYLAAVFSGADGRQLKASIMDENPGPVKISINGRYPDQVPLSTVPPQVLASLPRLPKEIEYRFVGDSLVLLDVQAHIVIDYVADALPA